MPIPLIFLSLRLFLSPICTLFPYTTLFRSLLLTTEARVLAAQMGQIVMVVQADKTSQADVQHALSTIEACPLRMLVLNKADRKSTRLNSSHRCISYAVFCLKKKKKIDQQAK